MDMHYTRECIRRLILVICYLVYISNCQEHSKELERIKKLQASLVNNILKLEEILWTQIIPDVESVKEKVGEFKKPSFISDWILMKSQDDHLSDVTIAHGLGVLPYKVDVQITPTGGHYAGWIFPGASAYQGDDDRKQTYGGVVYLYNDTHVNLKAPNKRNDDSNGKIIYTGHVGDTYLGSIDISESQAYVRVRAWGPAHLPRPSFQSEWQPLNISDIGSTFYEFEHGLHEYPALITVQIRTQTDSNGLLISDGMGSSQNVYQSVYRDVGGVQWASDISTVRVWAPLKNDLNDGHPQGIIANDGWGTKKDHIEFYGHGDVRVTVWSQEQFMSDKEMFQRQSSTSDMLSFDTFINTDVDLLSFFVQANDGSNKGYRFYCSGNAQAIGTPYGFAHYAYTNYGRITVWKPNPDNGGYLIHVSDIFGGGRNSQASNNALYGCVLLKPYRN